MKNELTTNNSSSFLNPQSFEQAERYAEIISKSSLCPTAFKGKPGDVMVAIMMGAEVGLSPMQAIQNIAVINGRPSLWGDAALAVVRVHPSCQSVREWIEGTIEDGKVTAYCAVIRKGQQEEVRHFTMEMAKKAGLWSKAGVWNQYPLRMLQMRARGFAIRDTFPDALRGLHLAEESQDFIDVEVSIPEKLEKQQEKGTPMSLTHSIHEELLKSHMFLIEKSSDIEVLKIAYNDAKEAAKGDKDATNLIAKATKDRKAFLLNQTAEAKKEEPAQTNNEFLAAYDSAEVK